MYDMYPDWEATMSERGEAGLGHPDYPIEARRKPLSPASAEAMQPNPNIHTSLSPETFRSLGYLEVKGMVNE